MFVAKLRTAAAAAALIAVAVAGTGVLAQHTPGRRPVAGRRAASGGEAPDRRVASELGLAARTGAPAADEPAGGNGDVEARGLSIHELDILIAQAKRRLARNEKYSMKGTTSLDVVEDSRDEVEILTSRREAWLDDLRDELERLEGRLHVKQAEADADSARSSSRINARKSDDRVVDLRLAREAEMDLNIKLAEVEEVKIRIKQVKRRLERAKPAAGRVDSDANPQRK